MAALLFIVLFLVIVGSIAGPVLYLQNRRQRRELKNFERGLKMVPLLIHLPPPSEDTEGNGRDIRDVTDENISKAQIIYGIIASTLQKGSKVKLYGQRHFAFEVIASKGFIYFYAAVPVTLVEVVKQAVVSAYPSARLEEAMEHNIFNKVGKLSGTVGGEMKLKESYAFPIATYQDLKRDSMQALLNALSTLDREDGAAIQIIMRPADPAWRKNVLSAASKKKKGEDGEKKSHEQLLGLSKEIATAFVKPPEAKDKDKDSKPLSGHDQAVVDSMEDKARQSGFEVLIRVVVSSNISQRAQSILNNITASFSLYDAPGKNGFKFEAAENVEELTTNYILRIFPQDETKTILNTVELATIFHFPEQKNIPTAQLERQSSRQVDAPRNMPDEGLLLGYNVFRGIKKPVRLTNADRARHMYVVGQTGTGKSTYLENLALQDMLSGRGFAFVDPHGDTAEKLLSMVPKERTEDVIYFSPSDVDYPLGLNLFEAETSNQKDFVIQEVLNMLYKLYDPQRQGIMGPRYENLFRNAALTVMADPAGGTFIDIPKLFRDPAYVKQKLQYVKDPTVLEFWQKEIPQSQRSNDFGEIVGWFVSKFGAFLSNEMMRNIIGQTESAFDIRDLMDNGKILLVNLSKGKVGQLNMQLLGMIFVMKFQAAAMSRANIPESERRDFTLYVDEFQNFSTDSFATILSEARKYHLDLIVANQYTTQLTDEIRDAVFGNTGTLVAFRVGHDEDAEALSKRLRPAFDATDLLRMPNYNAGIRILIGGVPAQPFSMAALPPLGNPNEKLGQALKQLSAAKYGRPKAQVEKEIFERLAVQEAPALPGGPAAFGGGQAPAPSPYGPAPQPPRRQQPGAAGSFLDEWMSKRTSDKPLLRPNPWQKNPPAAAPAPVSPAPQLGPIPGPTPMTPGPMTQPAPPMPPVPPANIPPPNESSISRQEQDIEAVLNKPIAPIAASPTPIELPEHPQVAYGAEKDTTSEGAAQDADVERELQAAAEEVHKKLVEAEAAAAETVTQAPAPDVTEAADETPAVSRQSSHEVLTPETTKKETNVASKDQQAVTDDDESTGEIPLLKTKSKKPADDSESDTISIDADGTLRIR
jgi:hypothetical protein